MNSQLVSRSSGLHAIAIGAYFIAAFVMLAVILSRFHDTERALDDGMRDVKAIWLDSEMLLRGENPYRRLTDPETMKGRYTFYLPGFVYATATSIYLGLDTFPKWMKAWRYVAFAFHFAVGALLFFMLYRGGHLLAGMFGATLWYFSRWPLALFKSGQIDAVPILFFLLALYLMRTRFKTALVLFSVSLAIKQMAILVTPLLLVWAWKRSSSETRMRDMLVACLCLGTIPTLLSLPLAIWDFNSFFQMMVYPLTRPPMGPRSVDVFLGSPGLIGKLPFLGMLCCVYLFAMKNSIPMYTQVFLVTICLMGFSGVFFSRYVCWAVPLIPLMCFELAARTGTQGQVVSFQSETHPSRKASY